MMIRLIPADGGKSLTLPQLSGLWTGMVHSLATLHDIKLTVGNDGECGWDEILCPSCNQCVDPYWFAELFDTQGRFANQQSQVVTMPCCASNFSLAGLCKIERQPVSGLVIAFRAQGRTTDLQLMRKLEAFLHQPLHAYYDLEQCEDGTVCYA